MTTKVKKTVQGIQKKLRHVPSRTYTIAGVLVFAAIGTTLIVNSKAATPTASYEAEAGTRAAPPARVRTGSRRQVVSVCLPVGPPPLPIRQTA